MAAFINWDNQLACQYFCEQTFIKFPWKITVCIKTNCVKCLRKACRSRRAGQSAIYTLLPPTEKRSIRKHCVLGTRPHILEIPPPPTTPPLLSATATTCAKLQTHTSQVILLKTNPESQMCNLTSPFSPPPPPETL